jgi:diguanylate cyclase (GGDEF)-like protein
LFLKDTAIAMDYSKQVFKFSIIGFIIILNIVRTVSIYYKMIDFEEYFFFFRFAEIFSLLSVCLFFDSQPWLYMTLVFPVAITNICKGGRPAAIIAAYAFVINFTFIYIFKGYIMEMPGYIVAENIKDFMTYYIVSVFVVAISARYIGRYNLKKYKVEEFEINSEMDLSYDKLIEKNQMLEDSNTMLAVSNAELFTVQYIVKEIHTTLNIKDLSNKVNDIIIGIMGATNCSLLFLDNEKKRFKLYGNTIKAKEKQIEFVENINCDILFNAVKSGNAFYDNYATEATFPFIRGRNVGSIMIVPISRDSKKSGVAIVEHSINEYFSDEKLRLMEVVGQQILLAFEKVELYNRVLDIAVRDGLTGVYNRVFFQQKLNEEIKRARNSGFEVTLVILDIDHFKGFNDTYGHTFGDKVIKHTVEVVKSSLRKGDVIARFGGEEFVIILPTANSNEAYKKIDSLRQNLQNTTIKDNEIEAGITASFGIASFPHSATTDDALIRAADEALYEAKNSGRNCVKVFNSVLSTKSE